MKLNYKIQGNGQPILFLHGMLGSLDNLNMLAKEFVLNFQTIQVDLRNHGLSPWSNEMNYEVMAEDVATLCQHLQLKNLIVVGHSMGGKVAMQLMQIIPDIIEKVVVIDIAPVKYVKSPNLNVIEALKQCDLQQVTDKKHIMDIMKQQGIDLATSYFLLKSFKDGHWLFNSRIIVKQYSDLCDWHSNGEPCKKPILFIRGENSTYITDEYVNTIMAQFPNAKIVTVAGAGHNVHAEKTEQVLQILHDFIMN